MATTTHGTASQLTVDGGYVEFQLAVLRALPRDIDPDIADGWRNNGQALAKVLREALLPSDKPATTPKMETQPILRFIDEITLPARTEQFVPRVKYIVNTKRGSHVKIGYIDPDFTAWFGKKVEEPTAGIALRRHVLDRPSVFAPAMKEVEDGGFVTETTPGQLFSVLEQQPDGPKSKAGPLLTNGYANLFKMIDVNGVARLVRARWGDGRDGWHVSASDASDSGRWSDGYLLFSSSSRLNSAA